MASESSSAVLDLKDDADDTDGATSLAEGPSDVAPPPLIMEHGYDIAVKVDAPAKQLSTLETFVTYRVRCVCARWASPPAVRRRYNHFKVLHARLVSRHPWLAPPPLPPLHSARQQLDRYSSTFVAVRAIALDAFLNRVAKHPILTHSEDFRIFLTTPDDEIDKVFKSENNALNLWGLSSALYGSGENKPVNGARVKDPEFTAAADYLHSLQHKLTALSSLTTKLYKGSVGLQTEYKGMLSACSPWAASERGRVSRALSGLAAGAASASAARGRVGLRHRAVLPMLAAYAAAHVEKIKQRDNTHAACVAGSNATDELHNRLEQASEALRSELTDWNSKTRSETKSILLELAEKQVIIHQQTLTGWEQALSMSTDTNVEELFKTVSKTAVQNLSPTKCQINPLEEPETEKDLEDLDIENYSNDDSDIQDLNSRLQDNFDSEKNVSAVIDLSGSTSDLRKENGKVVEEKTESFSIEVQIENVKDQSSKSDDMSKLDLTGVSVTSDPLQDFAEVDLTEGS